MSDRHPKLTDYMLIFSVSTHKELYKVEFNRIGKHILNIYVSYTYNVQVIGDK